MLIGLLVETGLKVRKEALRPRIQRILNEWPNAKTVTALLDLLKSIPAVTFLNWKGEDRTELLDRPRWCSRRTRGEPATHIAENGIGEGQGCLRNVRQIAPGGTSPPGRRVGAAYKLLDADFWPPRGVHIFNSQTLDDRNTGGRPFPVLPPHKPSTLREQSNQGDCRPLATMSLSSSSLCF